MEIKPIRDGAYLEELIAAGYVLKGPKEDPSKDLRALRGFLKVKKDSQFVPEGWLAQNGYKFVEPGTFTKGYKLAYKLIDGFPEQYFRSDYILLKEDKEIPLYLKSPKSKYI